MSKNIEVETNGNLSNQNFGWEHVINEIKNNRGTKVPRFGEKDKNMKYKD